MPLDNFRDSPFRGRYQRNTNRRRRVINRIYNKRRTQIDNLKTLPIQITNDEFAFQLFNGSPFY
jgi:hypothetical protein